MRHQALKIDASVAAVWPSAEESLVISKAAEAGTEPVSHFSPAAPDVPAVVGLFMAGAYASMLAVLFALFARSPLALYSITIVAGYVAIYIAIPRLFFAIEPKTARRPTLARFMREGIATSSGWSGGADALIQMLVVPVLVCAGLLVIGIIGRIYIP
jgi:hypothetical protein